MSNLQTRKLVPAGKAMILWNHGPAQGGDGRVKVVLHGDGKPVPPSSDLVHSGGACTAGWQNKSGAVMLEKLQSLAWRIVRQYGVDPAAVHAALIGVDVYHRFWKS